MTSFWPSVSSEEPLKTNSISIFRKSGLKSAFLEARTNCLLVFVFNMVSKTLSLGSTLLKRLSESLYQILIASLTSKSYFYFTK